MSALVHAAIAGSLNTSTVITDETYLQDAEEAGYQTGFVKLAAVEGLDVDYTKNFPDSKTVLQEAVVGCGVFNGLPADCQKFLQ